MNKTKNFVLMALFISIEVLLFIVPFLGFIPIGPLRATTMHIPVIIAGIVLGKKEGAVLGFVFGLLSFIMNTLSPTLTSFVFSPFISGNILSLVIAFVPRILIGYVSGLLYEKLTINQNLRIIISSICGALTNTILVLGGIYVIFGQSYAKAIGQSFNQLLPYFLTIITTNGLLEAIVGTIIVLMVVKAISKVRRI